MLHAPGTCSLGERSPVARPWWVNAFITNLFSTPGWPEGRLWNRANLPLVPCAALWWLCSPCPCPTVEFCPCPPFPDSTLCSETTSLPCHTDLIKLLLFVRVELPVAGEKCVPPFVQPSWSQDLSEMHRQEEVADVRADVWVLGT